MIARIIILAFVLLVSPSTSHAQQEFFPFVGQLNEDSINIRAGQSTNFEKLGKLKLDEQVVVVDKSYSWYKIRLPKHAKSFISQDFINIVATNVGEITGKRVNIRGGAGLNFTVLGQLEKGTRVSIVKLLDDGWVQIQPMDDSYGWVADKFLKFVSSDVSQFIPPEPPAVELVNVQNSPPPVQVDNSELYISDLEPFEEIPDEVVNDVQIAPEPEVVPEPIVEPQTEFIGVLTQNSSVEGYQYLLIEEGVGTFNLDGYSQLLSPFLNYRVRIEGHIKEGVEDQAYPVVVVKRIQLVL